MTDYGRSLEFGFFLEPTAADPAATLATARLADDLGLELLGVQDHPYQPTHLDTWTLLSAIGAQTQSIRIFPDVANIALRPPAVLAKSVASLDRISGGRAELGLGAGAFWDAVEAVGVRRKSPGQAVSALDEAIDITRLWWSGRQPISYTGRHHSLAGVHPGPQPVHDIGIWLGSYGPRMLDLVGRKANGWLPSLGYLPPDGLAAANARIDEAAVAAGRDPSSITRIYNVFGNVRARQWIELATDWALDKGMNGFVFGGPPTEASLRMIAEEIAPAVRDAVTKERRS